MLKTSGKVGVTTLTLGVLLSPSAAFAATRESAFCTNLSTTTGKINADLSNLDSKLNTAYTKRIDQFTSNKEKWDTELQAKRDSWDKQRQENFTKLEAKAKTDAQKAAVKAYEAAVTSAVTTRRSANDAARATFRTGVENAAASHRSTVEGQATVFKNAVTAAEATAQASCQSDPSQGATIRTTFRDALKSAREAYTNGRKGDDKLGDQIKALAQTRNAAIQANDKAFNTSMSAAREALKSAFGSTKI